MNKSEKQMHYLELYRQQLRKETTAMGYGQRQVIQASPELRERSSATSRQLIPALLATLGVVNNQVQPTHSTS